MIKNIAYFPLQTAANSRPVMNAVLDCFQAAGIQTQENSMDSDAAVIWSVLWSGRMKANQAVFQHYRSQNRPVVVIDIGALYRGHTWKIAVNNITAQGYYGHRENLNPDRPAKLGISLAINFTNNPAILVAGQHRASHQLSGVNQESWICNTVAELRKHTDRPIHVRPHPRCPLSIDRLPPDVTMIQPHHLANTYDSFDMHFDYHAVVNYNSGPGAQAGIAGARPVVHSSSLAHPISVPIDQIEQPYNIDRHQWLIEICHTEYTLDEIRKGIWLKRIRPALTV